MSAPRAMMLEGPKSYQAKVKSDDSGISSHVCTAACRTCISSCSDSAVTGVRTGRQVALDGSEFLLRLALGPSSTGLERTHVAGSSCMAVAKSWFPARVARGIVAGNRPHHNRTFGRDRRVKATCGREAALEEVGMESGDLLGDANPLLAAHLIPDPVQWYTTELITSFRHARHTAVPVPHLLEDHESGTGDGGIRLVGPHFRNLALPLMQVCQGGDLAIELELAFRTLATDL
jgi:hypothetical protein